MKPFNTSDSTPALKNTRPIIDPAEKWITYNNSTDVLRHMYRNYAVSVVRCRGLIYQISQLSCRTREVPVEELQLIGTRRCECDYAVGLFPHCVVLVHVRYVIHFQETWLFS